MVMVSGLCISAVIFIVRGPGRFPGNAQDFRRPYMQGRVWVQGLNPYERVTVEHEILGSELELIRLPAFRGSYPPIHSPVMASLGNILRNPSCNTFVRNRRLQTIRTYGAGAQCYVKVSFRGEERGRNENRRVMLDIFRRNRI